MGRNEVISLKVQLIKVVLSLQLCLDIHYIHLGQLLNNNFVGCRKSSFLDIEIIFQQYTRTGQEL